MDQVPRDLLAERLDEASRSFDDDELAYLALTSKIEVPVRDRLAWALQRHNPDIVVAREWRRRDIAVLSTSSPDTPIAVVEVKAGAANEVGNPDRFVKWLKDDISKARKTAGCEDAEIFGLLLATVITKGPIPRSLSRVVKYRSIYDRAVALSTPRAAERTAYKFLEDEISRYGDFVTGSLGLGGHAFGLYVMVDFWIVGPLTTDPTPAHPRPKVVRLLEVATFDAEGNTIPEPDPENDVTALFDDGTVYVDRRTRESYWRSFHVRYFPNMSDQKIVEAVASGGWSDGYTVIRSVPVDLVTF
jgi:hypothetical protein